MRSFRCVLHGSFRKYHSEIQRVHQLFTKCGIAVLAPRISNIVEVKDGFAILATDSGRDPRAIELIFLENLLRLGEDGFSYVVNPEGYIGKTVAYELGIIQMAGIPCFFAEQSRDLPIYLPTSSIWKPEDLLRFITEKGHLPSRGVALEDELLHGVWSDFIDKIVDWKTLMD